MAYKYPRTSKHELQVKRSSAGLGLFSKSNIPSEDFIIEYFGPILNDEEAEKKSGKYLFALNNNKTIDGTDRSNIARYINHSCKPNCEVEMNGQRLFIHAIKEIKPGEELTYNYGKEYFDGYIRPNGCKCENH